jgi:hypothetical protein
MKRGQFTADLSVRLRQQGVEFDPAALNEFAADVRDAQSHAGDMGTLAGWFVEASERYAVEARRRFVARHALREGLLFSVFAVLGIGIAPLVLGLNFDAFDSPTSQAPWGVLLLTAAELSIPLAAGIAGIARTVSAARTLRRSRREMEAAFRREPPSRPASAVTQQ